MEKAVDMSANDFFPFPGKELALVELSHDLCYDRIPVEDRELIADAAWDKGKEAAGRIFSREGKTPFRQILGKKGIACKEVDKDMVVGNRRYFCDYVSGRKEVLLYLRSISLWAEENSLPINEAVELILSHEFYHVLECTEMGLTSKDYTVPVLRIGKLALGKTGIRALSEIGAHAFARTYHSLCHGRRENDE